MSLEEYKRLYKHYMGIVKADGSPKEVQAIEADRMVDKAKLGYEVDITLKEKPKEETKSKEKK